jgi:ABC-2 type transport system ATP-binding protein
MIEVRDLVKTYRVFERPAGLGPAVRSLFHRKYNNVEALRGLSFDIAAGECVGFLGPNGAGKTTALKILSGLLYPSTGTVRVGGFVPQKREVAFLKNITLVMGQKQQLLWDLPPAETFAMNRAIYDLPRREADETQALLIELLDCKALIQKPTRQLSLGERMKCELVAALLHRPKVLFLDEPTIGLDVSMQARMREFVQKYNQTFGATILLTSHYMEDVTALCPRVIVIDKGRLLYDDTLRSLTRRLRPERHVAIRLSNPVESVVLPTGATIMRHTETELVLSVAIAQINDVVRFALAQLPVADLTIEDPPLEDVMRGLFAEGKQT